MLILHLKFIVKQKSFSQGVIKFMNQLLATIKQYET